MKFRAFAAALLCAVLSHAPAFAQATQVPPGEQCFQANAGVTGMVGLLGTVTGGAGGTTGTYGGVALTSGSGSGATANITVSGGAVTAVSILNPGSAYVVGDVLSAAAANIGSTTGFSVPVSSVSINSSLAGGSVTYYVPGTTTFKSTWRNSTQTTLNANPITLDQNGCAIVYGVGSYRQIVKDRLGNTVWDQVSVAPNPSPTSASSGAGDLLAIGTVIANAGFTAPINYVLTYGQALDRSVYPDALNALTISSGATCTLSSTTIGGLSSTAQMRVGAPIEASCLPSGTTISTIASSVSVTVNNAATVSGGATVRVFPWGNGNGSTTFNVPDLRGRVLPGTDAMGGTAASRLTATYFGTSAAAPGASGGAQSASLVTQNMPPYSPAGNNAPSAISATVTGQLVGALIVNNTVGPFGATTSGSNWNFTTLGISGTAAAQTFLGLPQGGTSDPFSIIQPSLTINYAIKVLNGTLPTIGVLSIGGLTGDILCGAGIACSPNNFISVETLTGSTNPAWAVKSLDGTQFWSVGNCGDDSNNFWLAPAETCSGAVPIFRVQSLDKATVWGDLPLSIVNSMAGGVYGQFNIAVSGSLGHDPFHTFVETNNSNAEATWYNHHASGSFAPLPIIAQTSARCTTHDPCAVGFKDFLGIFDTRGAYDGHYTDSSAGFACQSAETGGFTVGAWGSFCQLFTTINGTTGTHGWVTVDNTGYVSIGCNQFPSFKLDVSNCSYSGATATPLNGAQARFGANGEAYINTFSGQAAFATAALSSGGAWSSPNASAAIALLDSDGSFKLYADTGLTPNSSYTPTLRFTVSNAGAVTFNSFGAGTLTTNASGEVSATTGITGTKTVRASGGASDCTLIFTKGLLTGGSC